MSLFPAFKFGLWNAWILMTLLYAASFIPLFINKEKVEKRGEGEPDWSQLNRNSRITFVITHIMIMPFTLIYSVFLPLEFGSSWFIPGLIVFVIGFLFVLLASMMFSTAPLGEPMTKGIFAVSRNPGYLGSFLGYAGTGIACSSWVFLLCALVWIAAWHFGVVEEEQIMLGKYGDAYRDYMMRTPRWIGIPKTKG